MSGRPTKHQPWKKYNNDKKPNEAAPSASDDSDISESDSESETEDEDGEELTPVMDAAILRTLTRIRRGEGVEVGRNVFEEEQAALLASAGANLPLVQSSKPKSAKPIHLSDFQRQALLDSANPNLSNGTNETALPSHVQEQEALRKETLDAFNISVGGSGANGEEEDDGLFVKKKVDDVPEEEMEDEAYRAFLLGSGGGEKGIREALGLDEVENDKKQKEKDAQENETDVLENGKGEVKKAKKSKKSKTSEEDKKKADEEFLLEYILNRGWIDRSETHVPSYNEITAPKKVKKPKKPEEENSDLSADEKDPLDENESDFEDKADDFETRYNFRFEEPDAAVIPTHPRQLASVARRPDTARKDAREARKIRKAEEKLKREEEKKKLKNQKKKEIERKLALLGLGKDGRTLTLDDLDLDADFDPDAHDNKMLNLFENGNEWDEGQDDGEKPTWDDEFGGAEGYAYGMEQKQDGEESEVEVMDGDMEDMEDMEIDDGPINMDAEAADEPVLSSRQEKKKKKKEKKKKSKGDILATAASTLEGGVEDDENAEAGPSKVVPFQGTEEEKKRKVDEIMDEYYALDHEDMIGNLPTRFHYTKTAPQNYGLTPAEILMATDAELNQFLSIKQYAAFRADGGAGAGRVGRDKRLWELKKSLKGRTWGEEPVEDRKNKWRKSAGTGANDIEVKGEKGKGKKRVGKKERSRLAAAAAASAGGEANGSSKVAQDTTSEQAPSSKKRKIE
ncbi:KRR1-interacting protein involved in 40S ribosome biogenesis [Phaffia rhodozyma]|uniref:KRR1-interacting protein involved in 40S ribosome biogenesis n=1 Tax=Phaffia rhodozyma TaxID=264483 RepID=A0A0F7SED8_PHARH|nr:KRR1-interacting protein involved in 40S ribosome biogenesis [Phaffia rhodozyma]